MFQGFRPLTGIMIFNNEMNNHVNLIVSFSFRPLTGIMIFNMV